MAQFRAPEKSTGVKSNGTTSAPVFASDCRRAVSRSGIDDDRFVRNAVHRFEAARQILFLILRNHAEAEHNVDDNVRYPVLQYAIGVERLAGPETLR